MSLTRFLFIGLNDGKTLLANRQSLSFTSIALGFLTKRINHNVTILPSWKVFIVKRMPFVLILGKDGKNDDPMVPLTASMTFWDLLIR